MSRKPLFDVIHEFLKSGVGPWKRWWGGSFEMQPGVFQHLLEEPAAELLCGM